MMVRLPELTVAPDAPTAPRAALAWAALVYAVCVLALGYPALSGQFLVNPHSDQFIAGYGFREFGARMLAQTGSFPQWNPYIFGGMPFVAAMHGDIFYPTFILRALMPTDVAMTWSFILHVFLAGLFTYVFLRACGLSFFSSLAGGLAYMMGGNVAGLVSPGHDGKLYISALFPLTLFLVLRGVRDGRSWPWGVLAVVVGLAVLTPHPQLLQYLLLGSAAWALFLAFGRGKELALPRREALKRLALALGAVIIGGAIGAIQYIPVREYVPWSPRANGKGWEHAISYSMPPEELINTYLPQFTGMLDRYWGRNFIHLHSEYIGAAVLVLAGLAFAGAATRTFRRFAWFWLGAFVITLLWALGGSTPFFALVYALVPGTKYFRAPSTMLFFVSFCVAVLAALGAERVVRSDVSKRYLIGWAVGALVFTGLAVSGGLTNLALSIGGSQRADMIADNASAVALGGIRSFVFVALTLGVIAMIMVQRVPAAIGGWLLAGVVATDLWSVERAYWMFMPSARVTFASDPAIDYLKKLPQPGRVLSFALSENVGPADPYLRFRGQTNGLMVHGIRNVMGYHGNQLAHYDALLGTTESNGQLVNPNFWQMANAQYLLTNVDSVQFIPEARRVIGPITNAAGTRVSLFRLPGENPYSWVAPVIVKAPDDQVLNTVLDTRFDLRRAALFDTSAKVAAKSISALPDALTITTRVTRYEAGRVSISLDQAAPAGSALIVSENFYPGWHAMANNKPATVGRVNESLIGVELPAGTRTVDLTFQSASYETGKMITLVALGLSVLWCAIGAVVERKRSA